MRSQRPWKGQHRGFLRISSPGVFIPFVPWVESAGCGEVQESAHEHHNRRYSGGRVGRVEYQSYAIFRPLIEGLGGTRTGAIGKDFRQVDTAALWKAKDTSVIPAVVTEHCVIQLESRTWEAESSGSMTQQGNSNWPSTRATNSCSSIPSHFWVASRMSGGGNVKLELNVQILVHPFFGPR